MLVSSGPFWVTLLRFIVSDATLLYFVPFLDQLTDLLDRRFDKPPLTAMTLDQLRSLATGP